MIGTSLPELVFIHICIAALKAIVPVSAGYLLLRFSYLPPHLRLPLPAELWCASEVLFFLYYLKRREKLQRPAPHPPQTDRTQRQQLFFRTLSVLKNPEKYLSQWFYNTPVEQIKRDNVKQFLCWAFLDRESPRNKEEAEELEFYTSEFERSLKAPLEPGWNENVRCIRTTLDPVRMSYRSLVWYLIVQLADLASAMRMSWNGYRHYSNGSIMEVFPWRPHTLLSAKSPARYLSYWHRPHTSKNKMPIVFLHGLGIGIYPYIPLYVELAAADPEVGVIVIENMPISMRICHDPLSANELCKQINDVLEHHGFDKFVLMSHSYGTIISAYILRNNEVAPKIDSVILTDPVAFLLHYPALAYNFTARKPSGANEYQLRYFAARDPGIAHTISRHFFWSEGILWKEELLGRRTAVTLGAKDLLSDTPSIWEYLTDEPAPGNEKDVTFWENEEDMSTVVWYRDCDHAQVFDTKERRKVLVDLAQRFCLPKEDGVEKIEEAAAKAEEKLESMKNGGMQ